ncbi:hypothetical protein BRC86_03110 [Halobacteriales archaeon QS_3_64_16]|nr:MAG: hypothetical protein BRC86_03110 [Halobacteriales archaeon QS_3_64_16]
MNHDDSTRSEPEGLSRRALLGTVGAGSLAATGSLASLAEANPSRGPHEDGNANPNRSADAGPRTSAVEPRGDSVTVPVSSETTFLARATGGDSRLGGLDGTEWYVDGEFRATDVLDGRSATDEFRWSFAEPGDHVVEVLAYDRKRHYSAPTIWQVTAGGTGFRDRGLYIWAEAAEVVADPAAADRLFARSDSELRTLFLSWGAIGDTSPDDRAAFLRAAHERGLAVHALLGALGTAGIETARRVVAGVLAHNAGRPDAERFDGIHLDVEPRGETAGPFLAAYERALGAIPGIEAGGESLVSQELELSAAVSWWWALADQAPERTRRIVDHDALAYVVVMAYGGTMPEIERRLSRVLGETSAPYALAVETTVRPRRVADGSDRTTESLGGGLPDVDRIAAAIERRPPSPGYLGVAIHHYRRGRSSPGPTRSP